jgi:hypothetical protein
MDISEIFPPGGRPQRAYCDSCKGHLDLVFADFDEEVSGVRIAITGLPMLRCEKCVRDYLPDNSRFAIIKIHEQAVTQSSPSVRVNRKKIATTFNLTDVPFIYDADDYYYIPGLERPWNDGFLTPVFFNKAVLLKYDTAPNYRVTSTSATYGAIVAEDFSIPFGINKNGAVVAWLGDIARLPKSEQFYLRSENRPSDHSLGSEFYDAQIECIYTRPSRENQLIADRSAFIEACFKRFGEKFARLDAEVIDLAVAFNAPVVDTEKERRHVADTMNKIHLESLDNALLGKLATKLNLTPNGTGSLKRLQAILESLDPSGSIPTLLSPFYVLYDLRVAYSHLQADQSATTKLDEITARLQLPQGSGLLTIYERLSSELSASYAKLTAIVL